MSSSLSVICLALLGLIWILYKKKFKVDYVSEASPRVKDIVLREFQLELAKKSKWIGNTSAETLFPKLQAAWNAKDETGSQSLLDEQLKLSPDNLRLRFWKSEELIVFGHFEQDDKWIQEMEKMVSSPSTKCYLLMQRTRCFLGRNAYAEMRDAINETLPTLPASSQLYLLSFLAINPLDGSRSYLDQSFEWCEKALQIQPKNIHFMTIKGALLVEQSNFQEGQKLLEESIKRSTSDFDLGIASFYLGLLAKMDGETEKHAKLMKRAKTYCTKPWLVQRIENELVGRKET